MTISEGSNVASITLLGQYAGSFALQSGTFGGTPEIDPPLAAMTDIGSLTIVASRRA